MIFVAFSGVILVCYSKKKNDMDYPLWYIGLILALISAIAAGIRANVL